MSNFIKQNKVGSALRLLTLVCAAGLVGLACDSSKPVGSQGAGANQSAANSTPAGGSNGGTPASATLPAGVPADFFLTKAPSDAKGVIEAKQSAAEGDTVVVRGRIGGSTDPFVADRAMFTLADLGMKTCDQIEGDACKTPWDYCCEPPTEIATRSLTVQLLGEDGKVARLPLEGLGRLRPMAEVVVEGKVSKKRSDKLFIVDASHVYVKSE